MEKNSKVSVIQPINLKEIVHDKNPKLASRLPGFVYSLVNRLLHIKEVNEILASYGHLTGIPFIEAMLGYFNVKVIIEGEENLLTGGRYIFASNHPLGGFDGMILLKAVTERYGKSLFLVRDELTKIPPLAELFIPINKFGDQRRSAGLITDAYHSDNQILIFPSGLASRKIKGKITDLAWQKHFIQKSTEHQRDVIPVFMSGRNSWFFYFLANTRKKLGIKLNIEMFLLPDELFKSRGKTFKVIFGKPVAFGTFDRSKSANDWAAEVKQMVYSLNTKS